MTLSQLNQLKLLKHSADMKGVTFEEALFDYQAQVEARLARLEKEGAEEARINSCRDELIETQELILTVTSGVWIYLIDESELN